MVLSAEAACSLQAAGLVGQVTSPSCHAGSVAVTSTWSLDMESGTSHRAASAVNAEKFGEFSKRTKRPMLATPMPRGPAALIC